MVGALQHAADHFMEQTISSYGNGAVVLRQVGVGRHDICRVALALRENGIKVDLAVSLPRAQYDKHTLARWKSFLIFLNSVRAFPLPEMGLMNTRSRRGRAASGGSPTWSWPSPLSTRDSSVFFQCWQGSSSRNRRTIRRFCQTLMLPLVLLNVMMDVL